MVVCTPTDSNNHVQQPCTTTTYGGCRVHEIHPHSYHTHPPPPLSTTLLNNAAPIHPPLYIRTTKNPPPSRMCRHCEVCRPMFVRLACPKCLRQTTVSIDAPVDVCLQSWAPQMFLVLLGQWWRCLVMICPQPWWWCACWMVLRDVLKGMCERDVLSVVAGCLLYILCGGCF